MTHTKSLALYKMVGKGELMGNKTGGGATAGGMAVSDATSLKLAAASARDSVGFAVRSFVSSSLRGVPREEKHVPTVWVSNRQPLQGETIAIRVSVPPPRTPVGHLHNFLRSKVGGGLVHMSIAEERADVRAVVEKTIPVFRDGSDR